MNRQYQEPLLMLNQSQNQRYPDTDLLKQFGGSIIVPVYNNRFLLVHKYIKNTDQDEWAFLKDIPDPNFENYDNGQPYEMIASRALDQAIGIRNHQNVIDLGYLDIDGNNKVHVVRYDIHPQQRFNNLRFSNQDGIIGADLVDTNRISQLIKNGTIRDIFTLASLKFFM